MRFSALVSAGLLFGGGCGGFGGGDGVWVAVGLGLLALLGLGGLPVAT